MRTGERLVIHSWRDMLARGLVRAIRPALGLVIRFRLPWILRRKLLHMPPGTWLKRHGGIEEPGGGPPAHVPRMSVLLDARKAGSRAVEKTLRSLLESRGVELRVHVLASGPVDLPQRPEGSGDSGAFRPRIWGAAELGAALRSLSGESECCLCVALAGLEAILFHEHALAHLAGALTGHPDALLAYCDEVVQRGRKLDVFCKPAWDGILFETLNYVGPAVLARSRLLAGAELRDIASADLAEALMEAVALAGEGSVAHLPMPLFRVVLPPRKQHPRQRAAREAADAPGSGARPVVSAIIPTRDRPELLSACLTTLRRTVGDLPLEIILVDNGTICPEALAVLDAEASLGSVVLRDAGDFNYSRLVNLGAAAATGAHLLLLNNDIEFRSPGWLEEMLAYAARSDVGCAGACLAYGNGIVQHAGVVLGMYSVLLNDLMAGHAHHGWECSGSGHFGLLRHARTVSAVTAALLLVSRETYHAAGGFDEALAVSLNDVDFCLRVRRLGLRNVVVPVKGVVHLESASRSMDITPGNLARLRREHVLLLALWGQDLQDDAYYNPNLSLDHSYGLSASPRQRKTREKPVR